LASAPSLKGLFPYQKRHAKASKGGCLLQLAIYFKYFA
jgi:hypothetical protein